MINSIDMLHNREISPEKGRYDDVTRILEGCRSHRGKYCRKRQDYAKLFDGMQNRSTPVRKRQSVTEAAVTRGDIFELLE